LYSKLIGVDRGRREELNKIKHRRNTRQAFTDMYLNQQLAACAEALSKAYLHEESIFGMLSDGQGGLSDEDFASLVNAVGLCNKIKQVLMWKIDQILKS
jgi:hypothetical protein